MTIKLQMVDILTMKQYFVYRNGLKEGRAYIYFDTCLDPAIIQDQPLFKYWFHTINNILIIIYSQALFQDRHFWAITVFTLIQFSRN